MQLKLRKKYSTGNSKWGTDHPHKIFCIATVSDRGYMYPSHLGGVSSAGELFIPMLIIITLATCNCSVAVRLSPYFWCVFARSLTLFGSDCIYIVGFII